MQLQPGGWSQRGSWYLARSGYFWESESLWWWERPYSDPGRSEEHTSELQSLMRISYAVFCLTKNKHYNDRGEPYTIVPTLTRHTTAHATIIYRHMYSTSKRAL